MVRLLTDNVWSTLETLFASRSADTDKEQVQVAVAYLGSEAVNLAWKEGDSLVIALTKEHVAEGSVDLDAVRELLGRKVRVYTNPSLHAKAFLFHNYVVAGSANLSWNAKKVLKEAAIITDDLTAREDTAKFMSGLMAPESEVFPETLERYEFPDIWFFKTFTPTEYSEEREKIKTKVVDEFSRDPSNRGFTLTNIGVTDAKRFAVKKGDFVIILHNETEFWFPRSCHRVILTGKTVNGLESILFLKTSVLRKQVSWSAVSPQVQALFSSEGKLEKNKNAVHKEMKEYFR